MPNKILHLQWEGPLTFTEAQRRTDYRVDYGIYQVVGPHTAYGPNALLYIGQANRQTFGVRLSQEGWQDWQKINGSVQVYLGRLHDSGTPTDAEWGAQIHQCESLLILAHRPAHNSSGLYSSSKPGLRDILILNWGNRGQLLPEVSGARWTERFYVFPGYAPYGTHAGAEGGSPDGPDDEVREMPV